MQSANTMYASMLDHFGSIQNSGEIKLKRTIAGRTYNTETSTLLGNYSWVDGLRDMSVEVYQTRKGFFFEVHCIDDLHYSDRRKYIFNPIDLGIIRELVEREVVEASVIGANPPRSGEKAEPITTLYLRVPPSLKARIDEAANREGLSGNTWAMRCMERCLANVQPIQQAS